MELHESAIVSLAVLAATAALLAWHARQWRAAQRSNVERGELEYRRRQFRRRFQTTAALGAATAALPFGLIVLRASPKIGTLFFGAVLLLYVWAGVLALADIWAIKWHFGRQRDRNQIEQIRLKAELRRLQERQRSGTNGNGLGNGRAIEPDADARD